MFILMKLSRDLAFVSFAMQSLIVLLIVALIVINDCCLQQSYQSDLNRNFATKAMSIEMFCFVMDK